MSSKEYRLIHKETKEKLFFDLEDIIWEKEKGEAFCIPTEKEKYYLDKKMFLLNSIDSLSRWSQEKWVYTNDILIEDVGHTTLEWCTHIDHRGFHLLKRICAEHEFGRINEKFYDERQRYSYRGSLYEEGSPKLKQFILKQEEK